MHLIKAIQPAASRKKTKRKIVLAAGVMLGGIHCGGSAPKQSVRRPSIEVVDPAYGAPGSKLTIKGAHLDQGTLVAVFAGAETVPVERTAHDAVVVIPEGAVTGALSLRNEGGSSAAKHVNIAVHDKEPWASVAAGSFHTCGVKEDGAGWCWGENTSGQLGFPWGEESFYPREISGPQAWSQLTLGSYIEFGNTCGLDTDGALWCWGDNGSAQYGNGTMRNATKPRAAAAVTAPWTSVSLGSFHACGLADEQLYCWGTQKLQVLGDGEPWLYPVRVTAPAGERGWSSVAAGTLHTCAITSPGAALFCWGDNHGGQLGDGTTVDRPEPVAVAPGTRWRSVSSGSYVSNGNTCGIQEDESLWCWGDNGYGQVGDGSKTESLAPVKVAGAGSWRSVSVGGLHACAIDTDDHLWCWGGNHEGQLATGEMTDKEFTPVRVAGDHLWQMVATGAAHTCALTTKGELYCWGANDGGQLGYYSEDASSVPHKVDRAFNDW